MARIAWEKYKPVQISENYNDGIVEFFSNKREVDEYNTPIRGGKTIKTPVTKDWFRRLGVTAQEVYYSNADKMKVTEKIAVRGNVTIETNWSAKIEDKEYEVYRSYYNGTNKETEISLSEVV